MDRARLALRSRRAVRMLTIPATTASGARRGDQRAAAQGRQTKHDKLFEIAAWVAAGKPDNEIAGTVFLSPATVRTDVARAMTKLNARSRAHPIAGDRRGRQADRARRPVTTDGPGRCYGTCQAVAVSLPLTPTARPLSLTIVGMATVPVSGSNWVTVPRSQMYASP